MKKFNLAALENKNHKILSGVLCVLFCIPLFFLQGFLASFCYFLFIAGSLAFPYLLFPDQTFVHNWQRFFIVTCLFIFCASVILSLGGLPFYVFFAGVIIYALTSAHNIYLLHNINLEREEKIAAVWEHRINQQTFQHFQKSVPVLSGTLKSDAALLRVDVNEYYKARDQRITELSYDVLMRTLETEVNRLIKESGGLILDTDEYSTISVFTQKLGSGNETGKQYWQQALNCAQEIQKRLVDLNMANSQKLMPIVPLSLYLGCTFIELEYASNSFHLIQPDLGILNKNLALYIDTREGFMLMMSNDFCSKIEKIPENLCYSKFIQEKSGREFVQVKEYIAEELKAPRDEVETKFNAHLNFRRKDSRFNLGKNFTIEVFSPDLDLKGKLINFSKHGFLITLNKCLGRYSKIRLFLQCSEEKFAANLPEAGKGGVEVEIRYELYNNPDNFLHGVKIIDSEADASAAIFKTLLLFKA